MLILVDESLPVELAAELQQPGVKTVADLGWKGLKNGALLARAASSGFSVLITADQHIEHQQNLSVAELGVIVLKARSNRMEHLRSLVPAILQALSLITPGQVLRLTVQPLQY